MDEHVETLRRLRADESGETEEALTVAIEALEGPQWRDAPDGDGLYWAAMADSVNPRLVGVFYDDDDDVWRVFDHIAGRAYVLSEYPARLWSRLPKPPLVPDEEVRGG